MRKGIKKLLTVALTATLGLAALAGCGTGTSSNGDGSANGGTTKELSGKIQLAEVHQWKRCVVLSWKHLWKNILM